MQLYFHRIRKYTRAKAVHKNLSQGFKFLNFNFFFSFKDHKTSFLKIEHHINFDNQKNLKIIIF